MDISNISPSEKLELDRLAGYLKNTTLVQEKTEELSELSFRQWFADALQVLATGVGISMTAIVEYIKTMGCAIATGFKDGVAAARAKGEKERERIRSRRY